MFSRPVLFVCVLAAAVGVPYLLLDKNLAQTARGQWNRLFAEPSPKPTDAPPGGAVQGAFHPTAPATPAATIEEAFRFEIQPAWVISRWPNASTMTGAKQLGMRVALASGTRSDDVAGSLTYYFNEHHQLQRITFLGQTGDARRLLAAVVTRYGLQSLPTTDAAHYIAGNPKKPTSEVLVRFSPTAANQTPSARLEVAVDLRRADIVGWEKRQLDAGEPSLVPSSYRPW
jgi:hypothetical protein